MTRREMIAGALFAPVLVGSSFGKTRIDKMRISAVTDGIGLNPQDSLDFARHYGLRWVELRSVPGSKSSREYAFLSEAEIKETATTLAANGLKVSFLNTSLLKFPWPGPEQKLWNSRKDDLQKACVAANILGCDKLGVFTGQRTSDPKTSYARIAEEIGSLAEISSTYKVRFAIANEAGQNIATSQELAELLRLIPSSWVGCNWNPFSPGDYSALPKDRILNLQFNSSSILRESPRKLDWAGIVKSLEKDGYKNQIGLEGPADNLSAEQIEAARESMEDMLRIVG